jgi:3-polyprenyl-4-hydroxybenzoate decarboxylase
MAVAVYASTKEKPMYADEDACALIGKAVIDIPQLVIYLCMFSVVVQISLNVASHLVPCNSSVAVILISVFPKMYSTDTQRSSSDGKGMSIVACPIKTQPSSSTYIGFSLLEACTLTIIVDWFGLKVEKRRLILVPRATDLFCFIISPNTPWHPLWSKMF